jgi:hypothetical protein
MANATATYQPTVPISTFRSEYPNAKVMIAVGGWGDDIGFFDVTRTDASIQRFAADIATMIANTGADGVGESSYTVVFRLVLTQTRHRLGISWRQRSRLQESTQLTEGVADCCLPQSPGCYSVCYRRQHSLDCCSGKERYACTFADGTKLS